MANNTLSHTFFQPLVDLSSLENLSVALISLLAQLIAAWWLYGQYRLVKAILDRFLKAQLNLPSDVSKVFCLFLCPAIWGTLTFMIILASGYPVGYQILGLVPLVYGLIFCLCSLVPLKQSLLDLVRCKANLPFLLLLLLWSTFAAMPQWIYDQFNYHLAVPRLAMNWGNPAAAMVDGHLFATGLFELSIAPLWSLCFGEVFSSAVAQSYCFFLMLSGLWLTTAVALRNFAMKPHQAFLPTLV